MKRCVVAYATREEQWLWTVDVPAESTVGDVLAAARSMAESSASRADIPWDTAPVGIFGQPCHRTDVPEDGDRIELYRPLASDPRERRRARVQSERRAGSTGRSRRP